MQLYVLAHGLYSKGTVLWDFSPQCLPCPADFVGLEFHALLSLGKWLKPARLSVLSSTGLLEVSVIHVQCRVSQGFEGRVYTDRQGLLSLTSSLLRSTPPSPTPATQFPAADAILGERNGNPLQCSCLENPKDGGAWWAAIYGVAQSQTRLKRLSSSSSNNAILNSDL